MTAIKLSVPEDYDPNKTFSWDDHDFSGAGQTWVGSNQPRWKWSFDGKKLLMWDVDPLHGQPHHIEVTGMDFYKLAQGRVYVDADGSMEILVWSDRGSYEMQDAAVEAVDEWLKKKVGREADEVTHQSEGGVYQNLDPDNPDKDAMMSAYFGYPVKTKPAGPCPTCLDQKTLTGSELAMADPRYHGEVEPNTVYHCPKCT